MSKLGIGVMARLTDSPADAIGRVADFGLRYCQVSTWDPKLYNDAVGEAMTGAARDHGVTINTLWAGYPGPAVWNFTDGPKTIGLVPPEYRAMRVQALQEAARFAGKFHLPSITTHVGFIPENPNDPDFENLIDALRQVADVCGEAGIDFCFETGQETPVTLLRTIERIGTDNLGINLDTANLILYGKANPTDALDVIGRYVRNVHAKDGLYPTNGSELGKEVPLGKGKVDFPLLIGGLKRIGYTGTLTIEREISGPQQIADINAAIEFLKPMC